MWTINTYNKIAEEGLNKFEPEQYSLNETDDPDALLLRSQDLQSMKFTKNLKAVARAGAGTNNIPVAACSEKGIVVFNTPGANANAVKELVLASMILAARPILDGVKWVNTLKGPDISQQVENEKKRFIGTEIAGKQLGVIGLGAIGAMVANDAYRLGLDVVGYDPYVSVDTAWTISRRVKRVHSIEEVLTHSDYVTVHVPLIKETKNLFDTQTISLMKEGAILLNFSRGELVESEAVIQALRKGRLKQYFTDFAEEALVHEEKAVVFPHLGASTSEAEINCAKIAADTVKYFLETGNIIHSVNFPTVEIAFTAPIRLAIVNRNVTNMIGQMSMELAKDAINILNIINRGRGDYAYTLIDIEELPDEQLEVVVQRIKKVTDILSVRVIRNQTNNTKEDQYGSN
ncbi:3-phosphoglycerate dehydrogenase family protein [Carnobacterium mobile]|uniref:3-phosphoglycerate dehydrogenase family protein n=1 Tax=Carnobacterium mobile TaxID=2750 RepID=UPI0018681479|nr:3-phosphoglycerate dehydrogenase family protein [Carnobacterium mobile]